MTPRILVADDDPTLRRMLETAAAKWGYEVVAAADGTEAWTILHGADPPQLALLDWMMPGLDGVELVRRLRAKGLTTFVVLLTARDQKEDLIAGFEAGADDFMTKPVHLRELQMRLAAGARRLASTPNPVAAAPARPTDASLAGKIIAGRYRVERPIGSGGMGAVWEWVHLGLGSKVAIKFVKPEYASNAVTLARFELEARAAARMKTKHTVRVHDYGVTDDGMPYLVMERLWGLSLAKTVAARGPLPAREVVAIVAQCAQALSQAHAAGIVHRDVKPDNIMLVTDPDVAGAAFPTTVKLIDFGVAKLLAGSRDTIASGSMNGEHTTMTRDGCVLGTPSYMSPEQLMSTVPIDPRVDVWALAACAFYAMTGRSPFDGETVGEIAWRVCLAPRPLPSSFRGDVPPGFDAWFARACSREADARPKTVHDLARSLELTCAPHAHRTTAPPPV